MTDETKTPTTWMLRTAEQIELGKAIRENNIGGHAAEMRARGRFEEEVAQLRKDHYEISIDLWSKLCATLDLIPDESLGMDAEYFDDHGLLFVSRAEVEPPQGARQDGSDLALWHQTLWEKDNPN